MKKLSVVFVAALSVAAFGCKKKGGEAASPDCGAAVAHSSDLSKETMKKLGTDDKTMQKMVEIGIQRCKEDKWPADAVKCMVDAQTMSGAQACYDKLTQDQRDKMNKAAQEAMGMGGSGQGSGSAAPEGSAAGSDGGSAAGSGSAAAGSGSAAAGSGSAAAGSGSAAAGSGSASK